LTRFVSRQRGSVTTYDVDAASPHRIAYFLLNRRGEIGEWQRLLVRSRRGRGHRSVTPDVRANARRMRTSTPVLGSLLEDVKVFGACNGVPFL